MTRTGNAALPVRDQVIDFYMTYPIYTSTELAEIFKIAKNTAANYMGVAIIKIKARRKMELLIESGKDENIEDQISHITLKY